MRIHLGHHFYGAGNLGDDFMLAGFLAAMQSLAPEASFTACVPFALPPLQARFPQIEWLPYDEATRARCIRNCDAWLGVGGSPFQSALSRWFIDHLIGDAGLCRDYGKPMFYLGVGVQTATELAVSEVRELCAQAAAIWTRDRASADRLMAASANANVTAAADLAHLFFRAAPPPPAQRGRATLVANFDYAAWAGAGAVCAAIDHLQPAQRVWLAQEARELPGAEKALFATLADSEKRNWQLVSPDVAGAPLPSVMPRWPSGEWLITARFHAALAGAWAGSKIVVIATNEKLRGVAADLGAPTITPDASAGEVAAALAAATTPARPVAAAESAFAACREFVAAARTAGV